MIQTILHNDTIAALATPNGKGGIAIIKISGQNALSISTSIFRSQKNPVELPRYMIYGHIFDGNDIIDEAMICYMPSPKSYTGEDVIEFQTHGGIAVIATTLQLLYNRGIRPAKPGEFTQRAFLNGRIDLIQAESVMEVVSSETREQLRQSERLLNGKFSHVLISILDLMKEADTLSTINFDFPDQDIHEIHRNQIKYLLEACILRINELLQSTDAARRLRNGVTVVLTGPVNSGKSSLFNSLLGRKRSIVHTLPGTTRDWIDENIDLEGYPVKIIDTAGLRDTCDEIEKEGMIESYRIVSEADIIVQMIDSNNNDPAFTFSNSNGLPLIVYSKADLIPENKRINGKLYISTISGEGINLLKSEMTHLVKQLLHFSDSVPLLMIERHRHHLIQSKIHINEAIMALDTWSEEIVSFEIHNAEDDILQITGKNVNYDVLDSIFSTFCIGK